MPRSAEPRPSDAPPHRRAAARVDPRGGPTLARAFRVRVGEREVPVARVSGLALAEAAASEGAAAVRLTLARALGVDRYFYDWRRAALRDGEAAARPIVIEQLDHAGRRVVNAWALTGWPLAWTGPVFDANEGGLAWETLEIAAHDLIWLEETTHGRPA
jgi:hypothetical protein